MIKILLFLSLLGRMACAMETNFPQKFSQWQSPSVWCQQDTRKQIQNCLKETGVQKIDLMGDYLKEQGKEAQFTSEVYVVTLENGLKGVFKVPSSEEPHAFYAEVGAWKTSSFLEFPFVPPTVLREIEIDGKLRKGSLQLFIETPIDLLKEGEVILKNVSEEEKNNLNVFYFILGQWDVGPHNLLAIKDGFKTHLIAIDNAEIFNQDLYEYNINSLFRRISYCEELNTNDWDQSFPFDSSLEASDLLSKELPQEIRERIQKISSFYKEDYSEEKPVRFVIYRNTLWRNYPVFDEDSVKSYAKQCSLKILKALKKLDRDALTNIFKEAQKADLLTESFLKNILARKDQILSYAISKS